MIDEIVKQSDNCSSEPELDAIYKDINFIKINISYDKEVANGRYQYDYDNNIDGTRDMYLSFNQWMSNKEYLALHFYANYLI